MIGGHDGAEQSQGRTQTAQGDAHLVHPLRVVGLEQAGLVAQQVVETLLHGKDDGVLHRRVAADIGPDEFGPPRGFPRRQGVAAARLAGDRDAERRLGVDLTGQIEEPMGRPRLKLQFQLAHGLRRRRRDDLADVDVEHDPAPVVEREPAAGAFERGAKNRFQALRPGAGDEALKPFVGDGRKHRRLGGDRTLPLGTHRSTADPPSFRLDALDVAAVRLPYAERDALAMQVPARRIVINAEQRPGARPALGSFPDKRQLANPRKVLGAEKQLQFGFLMHPTAKRVARSPG